MLMSLPGLAWGAVPATAELLSEPFLESYQPEVEVSGNVIVGVMSGAAQSALLEDRLGVWVSRDMAGTEVCVRATSNDGIYSSRNHYRLPGTSERAHLPYSSDMDDVLGGFGQGGLAVSVATGNCDLTAADTYLVAGSLDEAGAEAVTVFVNGFGATDVFVDRGNGSELEPCDYVAEGRRTTYDFLCTLTTEPGQTTEVTIVRERFGREQPGIPLTLIGYGE
jgi:hypothetical protein